MKRITTTCECCGGNEFIRLNNHTIKCAYCETIFAVDNADTVSHMKPTSSTKKLSKEEEEIVRRYTNTKEFDEEENQMILELFESGAWWSPKCVADKLNISVQRAIAKLKRFEQAGILLKNNDGNYVNAEKYHQRLKERELEKKRQIIDKFDALQKKCRTFIILFLLSIVALFVTVSIEANGLSGLCILAIFFNLISAIVCDIKSTHLKIKK